jgi:alginate O-acetyltransferase complex protein AlgI
VCLAVEHTLRHFYQDAKWTVTVGGQLLLAALTYVVVCFAWVFFRAADFPTASRLIRAMVGVLPAGDAILTTREIIQVGCVTAALLVVHWKLRDSSIESVVTRLPRGVLVALWTGMLCSIILTQGNGHAFIYFQF